MISRQPSAVSRQPSAVSRQPSAVSRQPSAVSRQIASDLHYVSQLISQPEWDGNPDLDITFLVGVIFRTTVINVLLLPTGILGKYFHNKVNATGI